MWIWRSSSRISRWYNWITVGGLARFFRNAQSLRRALNAFLRWFKLPTWNNLKQRRRWKKYKQLCRYLKTQEHIPLALSMSKKIQDPNGFQPFELSLFLNISQGESLNSSAHDQKKSGEIKKRQRKWIFFPSFSFYSFTSHNIRSSMSVNKWTSVRRKKLMRFFYLSIAWDYTKARRKQHQNNMAMMWQLHLVFSIP